jgi:hypothetical protein
MSQDESTDDPNAAAPLATAGGGARAAERPRWERPRILSREELEAFAAVCAPTPPAKGNPGFCPQGPISS